MIGIGRTGGFVPLGRVSTVLRGGASGPRPTGGLWANWQVRAALRRKKKADDAMARARDDEDALAILLS